MCWYNYCQAFQGQSLLWFWVLLECTCAASPVVGILVFGFFDLLWLIENLLSQPNSCFMFPAMNRMDHSSNSWDYGCSAMLVLKFLVDVGEADRNSLVTYGDSPLLNLRYVVLLSLFIFIAAPRYWLWLIHTVSFLNIIISGLPMMIWQKNRFFYDWKKVVKSKKFKTAVCNLT